MSASLYQILGMTTMIALLINGSRPVLYICFSSEKWCLKMQRMSGGKTTAQFLPVVLGRVKTNSVFVHLLI